jgi:hypothetical protein
LIESCRCLTAAQCPDQLGLAYLEPGARVMRCHDRPAVSIPP